MAGTKVHHLNCGSFCALGHHSGCHVLLIEAPKGLVLVDTGYGEKDVLDPNRRLGLGPRLLGAELNLALTAKRQIQKLGFQIGDVAHIILTHLDPDHMGGVSDFPNAELHLYELEWKQIQILRKKSTNWKQRIREVHINHKGKWNFHPQSGDSWKGLEQVRFLNEKNELGSDLSLIPLAGHTPAHCGVLISDHEYKSQKQELLHCGDAYFDRREISDRPSDTPWSLLLFQAASSYDNHARLANHEKLRSLTKEPSVELFCSHDLSELQNLKNHS